MVINKFAKGDIQRTDRQEETSPLDYQSEGTASLYEGK